MRKLPLSPARSSSCRRPVQIAPLEGGYFGRPQFDVTSAERWETAMADVEREHGRLDVLVNAAGIEGRPVP